MRGSESILENLRESRDCKDSRENLKESVRILQNFKKAERIGKDQKGSVGI